MNNKMKTGFEVGLSRCIDIKKVLRQPREAGGHSKIFENIFKKAEIISFYKSGGYEGEVVYAYKIHSSLFVILSDYYGSCSGCDAWEDASDEEAIYLVYHMVNHARTFETLEDLKNYCKNVPDIIKDEPQHFPWREAKNLKFD